MSDKNEFPQADVKSSGAAHGDARKRGAVTTPPTVHSPEEPEIGADDGTTTDGARADETRDDNDEPTGV